MGGGSPAPPPGCNARVVTRPHQQLVGPWPISMLPLSRCNRVGMAAAAQKPSPELLDVTLPWRMGFQDPVVVACPLYELKSFCPILGIHCDAMHTRRREGHYC